MKLCTACNILKENDCFLKNRAQCRICRADYCKKYRSLNKATLAIYNKEYSAEYYKNNTEAICKQTKKYRAGLNKEEQNIKHKKWRNANKDILNKKNSDRYKNDKVYKLRRLASKSIFKSLKRIGLSKEKNSYIKALPYSMAELKVHLESQFEPWMTWENHGKYNARTWNDNDSNTWTWNLDHVVPQTNLPYTSMEDDNFKKCWALENLRPLSSKINIIEGNRR